MWFTLVESLRAALGSLKAHGFRNLLTTIGITIGVAAIIATVSIIEGLSVTIGQQFQGLGTNSVTIRSYTPMRDRMQGRISRVTPADLEQVNARVEGIESVTPILYSQANQASQVRHESNTTFASIIGTTFTYQSVGQLYMRYGRFLSYSDDSTRRRVGVIGETVRKDLGLADNPVGSFIEVNGEWVKIIGLAEPKGAMFGQSQDNFVLIPYSTMERLIGDFGTPDIAIALTVTRLDDLEGVRERIKRLLRKTHKLSPASDDDFLVQTAAQLTETFNSILDVVRVVMLGIVGISLIVGGLGIMNNMLMSVTERTREIGICKALGAKRHHVLMQFLLEALALCLIGGIAGVLLGYGVGTLVAAAIPGFPAASTPAWAIPLALGFSGVIGVLFGILPAAKAANLDPTEALRRE